MFLREFTVTGADHHGAVNLIGAHIGGQLDCSGAKLCNGSGPALIADGLQVDQSMFLREFAAAGAGDLAAVRLVAARIGGNLDCTGADLRNDSGTALNADSLQVGQAMHLAGGFTGGGENVALDLTGARVAGAFRCAPTRLEHKVASQRRLDVDGLTYAGVPETGPAWDWRKLLRRGTPRYAARPYQQLAAGYRALGDDRQARETLMAQRDDQLARTDPGWWERLWGWITKPRSAESISGLSVSAQVTAPISPVGICTYQVQPLGRDNRGLTWVDADLLLRSSVDSGLEERFRISLDFRIFAVCRVPGVTMSVVSSRFWGRRRG